MLEQISIHAFIEDYGLKTETGVRLDFRRYPFLFDIYRDESPFLCCMKAAQIGFSTFEIIRSLYDSYYRKYDTIYVLPTADDVKQFSGGKTNRILNHNPVLQTWTEDKDSVEQKRVGNATIYYRGSWTERTALMISAQKLIVDEYDRCKQDVIEQYDSRLQAVTNPRKAFFSNPSIADFAIHKLYQQSDQKKWYVTPKCGHEILMDEKCVNYDAEKYECPLCRTEITDEDKMKGKWKATSQGEWSGYWIPLWITVWTPASKIAQFKKEKSPEYFANFVAGLPYLEGGDKVSAQTIIRCLSSEPNDHKERVIIGVDSGLPYHIVCANKDGYFYYDTLPSLRPLEELKKLMRRWPNSIIVADQGGDLTPMRALQMEHPGRVFLVWYRKDKKSQEIIKWGKDKDYGSVQADRNQLIQMFIGEMQDRRVKFNGSESEWQEYISHWLNIYRTWEDNALGVKEFKWERIGPDHYVHATMYARIGLSKFSEAQAKIIGQDPLEGIPRGYGGEVMLGTPL